MRRRRRLRWIVLAALVVVLVAFLQGPARVQPDPEPRQQAEATVQLPAPVTEPERHADPESAAAAADRVAGSMHRFETALGEGRLGAAWLALEAARASPADPARMRACAEAEVRLAQAQQEFGRTLASDVRAGRLLAARARLQRLRTPAHPRVEALLAELGRSRAWPPLPPGTTSHSAAARPQPEPGRAVRARLAAQVLPGTVQSIAGSQIGVRMIRAGHVTFPILACSDVELAEPSCSEAIAEAAAARTSGDDLGAALWLAHLIENGHGADPRVRALK